MIVSRIYLPEPSAASYALAAIAERLKHAGHEVSVLTTTPLPSAIIGDPPGIRVRRARALRDRSGYIRGYLPYLSFDLPLAIRLLLHPRAELYIVEPPPTTGAVVRVMCALMRRPYLYDAADIWSDAARMATGSRLVLRLLRWIELFALRGAAHASTISQGVVDRVRELGVATPMTVVGFGVDASVFRYEAASTPQETPYFVYAGTYSEWHGAEIFIDAFAQFSREYPGHRLLFFGNGSERDALRARVNTLKVAGVEFHEPIPGSELARVLTGATASLASLKPDAGYDYAFTSKVYSSMAVGCPVVFTGPGPTIGFLADAERSQRSAITVAYDVHRVADALAAFALAPLSSTERLTLSDWTRERHSLTTVADRVVVIAEAIVKSREA